jgi:hypothetical protein
MMERKISGNINSPSGYQYRIFTRILAKVTRKCECFGRNVEPCIDSHYDKSAMFSFLSLASETTFTFL